MSSPTERADLLAHFQTTLAPAICAALGALDAGDWRIEAPRDDQQSFSDPYVWLRNGDEAIRLNLDAHERRLSAWGRYGQRLDGRQWIPRDANRDAADDPHPRMSLTKTPAQIAADLCRRLLPVYREHLAAYHAQRAQEAAHRDGTHGLGRELVAASEGLLKPYGEAWRAADARTLRANGEYGALVDVSHIELELSSADSVHFKLTVAPAQARELVAWLTRQTRRPTDD